MTAIDNQDNTGIGHALLDPLRQLLLELYRGSRERPAEEFKNWALERAKAVLPFDMAVWVNGAQHNDEAAITIHNGHMHKLPADFWANWERFKAQDRLLPLILNRPGRCFTRDDAYAGMDREQLEIVQKHSRVYGIVDALSVAVKEPVTGLFSIISLYRNSQDRLFTREQQLLFQFLMPHLSEAADLNRFHHVNGLAKGACRAPWGAAICDRFGVVHQVDAGFPALLRREWPQWRGDRLPEEIAERLSDGSQHFHEKHVGINITALDDVFLLQLRPIERLDRLTPRELAVAGRLAHGERYKSIAEELCISPSTVNKHVQAIYAKLEVKNKVELAQLFAENEAGA